MSQLQDGQRYAGRPTGTASVYENDKGSLVLCMEIDVQGEMLRYYAAIATADSGINTRTVANLKAMFGWDGQDPFWFVDHGADYAEREVSALIEMKALDRGGQVANIKYLDTPGGGAGGGQMPEGGNRASLLAKYGSKLRAIAGGAPAAKPPAKPPVQASLPLAKGPPTLASIAKISDQGACWERFNQAGGLEADWFKTLEAAVPGVDQGDLTPAQWGKVFEYIETNLVPM
jgi:hypothetical protein